MPVEIKVAMVAALALTLPLAGLPNAATAGPVSDDRLAVAARAAGAPISAPTTVDPGQTVTVEIAGAAAGGRVELWGPVTSAGLGERILSADLAAGKATLTAPNVAGSYQLRHVNASGAVLARQEFEVAAVPVSLHVPVEAVAGRAFQIIWRGPAHPGDHLEFVDAASGDVLGSTQIAGDPTSANSSALVAPGFIGKVKLRYVTQDGIVLQAMPMTLTYGTGWLRTPIEVSAGERFEVQWYGVARPGHVLRIVDAGTGAEVHATVPEGPEFGPLAGKLVAPQKAGSYLIEYADPAADAPASQVPLKVNAS